ncbi:MAG TPA: hypothetical protein VGI66_13640, partial [Streptosporangiaceae bacterium]
PQAAQLPRQPQRLPSSAASAEDIQAFDVDGECAIDYAWASFRSDNERRRGQLHGQRVRNV